MDKLASMVKAWVINLDDAVFRWQLMLPQLELLPFAYERFSAIRGANLSIEHQEMFLNQLSFRLKHGKAPVLGELGCYLSHIRVLESFLASSYEVALVLEDDVVFDDSISSVVLKLLSVSDDWDLIKLSGTHSGTPIVIKKIDTTLSLAVPITQFTGSSAYLINRRAAQALVKHISVMSLPWDHAFDRNWRYDFKLRVTVPLICGHGIGDGSTINYGDRGRVRRPLLERLPSIGYRIYNELSRLLFRTLDAAACKLNIR